MSALNWKTIDKLRAKVPGVDNSYHGENVEFDVRLGRSVSPLYLSEEYNERFRIENKQFDICVEADSLQAAKKLLKEKLAASEDYNGEWKLIMHVDVGGGLDERERYGAEERANCTISLKFYVELTTRKGSKFRKRHMSHPGPLPKPFTGEFTVPKTHKELSNLKDGPVVGQWEREHHKNEVYIEATPELVETLRLLQERLGVSGEQAKTALQKKKFFDTIKLVQEGQTRLLGTGIIEETNDQRKAS